MPNAKELTPGVYLAERGLSFCPGCGLEDLGLDHTDQGDVLDWCKATFAALKDLGVPWCTQQEAEKLAADYMREPWHES